MSRSAHHPGYFGTPRRPLAGLIVLLALTLGLILPPAALAGTWSFTKMLWNVRVSHTATLLPNGRVLAAGGGNLYVIPQTSAEFYDPIVGDWFLTASMSKARAAHSATLLTNGKVLVAGGTTNEGLSTLTNAELYDPVAGTWSDTDPMNSRRALHTATLLPNGKVLVVGGYVSDIGFVDPDKSAELYDPVTEQWSVTVSNGGYAGHSATLLSNGQVLVAGGQGGSALRTAWLYNSTTATWSYTGYMNVDRVAHTATLLANGQVLVAGGSWGLYYEKHSSAELYDPTTGLWEFTGPMNQARSGHSAVLLPDGRVIVAGGYTDNGPPILTAEIYDPATKTWRYTSSLGQGRSKFTATLLPNGRVLAAGGMGYPCSGTPGSEPTNLAELYNPAGGNLGYLNLLLLE